MEAKISALINAVDNLTTVTTAAVNQIFPVQSQPQIVQQPIQNAQLPQSLTQA